MMFYVNHRVSVCICSMMRMDITNCTKYKRRVIKMFAVALLFPGEHAMVFLSIIHTSKTLSHGNPSYLQQSRKCKPSQESNVEVLTDTASLSLYHNAFSTLTVFL